MIRPIKISPIETTSIVYFKCDNCRKEGTITFTNRVINTDNENDLKELEKTLCPYCNFKLMVDKGELLTCPNCGEEKPTQNFKILGKVEAHEKIPGKPVVINRVKFVCAECWEELGGDQAEV